jgi:hypothetical protein
LREQPPSDSEAHFAFAFSHMLPGPPPNLVKSKIKINPAHNLTAAIELAGVQSHRIRNTVTNDSIAPNAQPLIWGVFARIRFAVPVNVQPDWIWFARIVLLTARTAG